MSVGTKAAEEIIKNGPPAIQGWPDWRILPEADLMVEGTWSVPALVFVFFGINEHYLTGIECVTWAYIRGTWVDLTDTEIDEFAEQWLTKELA